MPRCKAVVDHHRDLINGHLDHLEKSTGLRSICDVIIKLCVYDPFWVHPFPLTVTTMPITLRRRNLSRFSFFVVLLLFIRFTFFPRSTSTSNSASTSRQIQRHNFIERATRPDRSLNVQRHPFLQSRMGRDERPDIFSSLITNGMRDYWERFQLP